MAGGRGSMVIRFGQRIPNKSRVLHSVETDLAGAGDVTIVRLNDQKRVINLTIQ